MWDAPEAGRALRSVQSVPTRGVGEGLSPRSQADHSGLAPHWLLPKARSRGMKDRKKGLRTPRARVTGDPIK